MLTRRTLLALAAALVTGCSGNADVAITKHFSGLNVPGTGDRTYTLQQHVDLSAEGGVVWRHRDAIRSLDLVGLDATVTAVNSGGPSHLSGTIQLSRNGATVPAGSFANELVQVAPHSIAVTLSPEGASLIEDALRGDGQFDVLLAVSTDTAIDVDADVSLHVAVKYKITHL